MFLASLSRFNRSASDRAAAVLASLSRLTRSASAWAVSRALAASRAMRAVSDCALAAASRFFTLIAALPFDRAAAEYYAKIPFRRGRFDRLIAAHALALGLTVVTANEADFADVPGLRVENWTQP